LEGKKTELNRTEINRFEPVFGSVRFKKLKKKFGLVIYFGLKPDRTGNAQLSTELRMYRRFSLVCVKDPLPWSTAFHMCTLWSSVIEAYLAKFLLFNLLTLTCPKGTYHSIRTSLFYSHDFTILQQFQILIFLRSKSSGKCQMIK
jgi:hypothetical protein